MADDDDLLLTDIEAGEFIGGKEKPLSPRTLAGWRSRRYGPPFVKPSPKCVRYRISDLRTWMASRRFVGSRRVDDDPPRAAQ